ncbi:MAG: TadE/TadG family type IV pilus assembly protein [Anaerolineales bacterium]|nr:TadE/TadG family type IV pilus assembly protein [Anaerolineales bacterium]
MHAFINKFLRREGAQGIVEFALIIPVLLMLLLGVIELGRLLFIYSVVFTSSREAARYGAAAGDIMDATHSRRYEDCAGMIAAAKRVGNFASLQDDDITISYDHGPSTGDFADCSNVKSETVSLGDRVVVQVVAQYQPILPLVDFPSFSITSISRRTILKNVDIEGAPPP